MGSSRPGSVKAAAERGAAVEKCRVAPGEPAGRKLRALAPAGPGRGSDRLSLSGRDLPQGAQRGQGGLAAGGLGREGHRGEGLTGAGHRWGGNRRRLADDAGGLGSAASGRRPRLVISDCNAGLQSAMDPDLGRVSRISAVPCTSCGTCSGQGPPSVPRRPQRLTMPPARRISTYSTSSDDWLIAGRWTTAAQATTVPSPAMTCAPHSMPCAPENLFPTIKSPASAVTSSGSLATNPTTSESSALWRGARG